MRSVLSATRQNDPYFEKKFRSLNWLSIKDCFNQSITSIVFKYFTNQCPSYLNKVFELACPNNSRTRNSYLKLICTFRKGNTGQNAVSFIGPTRCNKTPEVLRKTNNINTFKHNLKRYYLTRLKQHDYFNYQFGYYLFYYYNY